MGDRASHGSTHPNGGVTDEPEAGREQGESTIERALELALAHEGADPQRSARLRHAVESGHAIDVDEHGRPGQPEVQHRGQALAAGQDLRLVAVATQVVERLVDRARIDVVERRRLHAVSWSTPGGVRVVSAGAWAKVGATDTSAAAAARNSRLVMGLVPLNERLRGRAREWFSR